MPRGTRWMAVHGPGPLCQTVSLHIRCCRFAPRPPSRPSGSYRRIAAHRLCYADWHSPTPTRAVLKRGGKGVRNANRNERSRDALCFMVEIWARHKNHRNSIEHWLAVGGGWRLAVGGWRRLAVCGCWRLLAVGDA